MNWFNYIGLIIIILIMIPNIIYFKINPSGFNNIYKNKYVELFEQIGRYGCFILMIFNIPYTYFNFWFNNALIIYIVVNLVLVILYLLGWIFCNKHFILRAYLLSIIPSIIFIFCGIMILYIPLIILSIIFSICHITISLKNAYGLYKK